MDRDPWALCIAPDRFAEQVDFLARRRTVLCLSEFVDRQTSGTLPRNAVAITFDDGYVDNLRNAEPILAGAGLQATLFVVSGMVGRPGAFWWDELADMILARDEPLDCRVDMAGHVEHLWLPAPERVDRRPCDHLDGRAPRSARQAVYVRLWRALQLMSPGERDIAMDRLRRVAPPTGDGQAGRVLTAAELRGLAERGTFAIGAHTVSHPRLPSLGDEDRRYEIEAGRDELQSLVDREIRGFAYPYGEMDGPTRDAAARAGFDWACATVPVRSRAGSDLFELPRISAPRGGAAALAWSMAHAPAWEAPA